MSAFSVEAFDPHAVTRERWAAYHAFRRARGEEDDPGEPMPSDDDTELALRQQRPLYENRRFVALAGDAIIGVIGFGVRREGTPDYPQHAPYVEVWGGVLQPWRRRGVATALLGAFHRFMLERAKSTATVWVRQPEGHAFLQSIGAALKHRSVENRLLVSQIDWDVIAGWRAHADAAGLTWEIHAPRVPLDRFAEILPQVNMLLQDVPISDLDEPPMRWEVQSQRTYYDDLDRHGGSHYLVLLMAGEDIAALCETNWDARYPDRIYQALTATARPWRGKGLAKGVKAAMLQLIRARHPEVSLMITGNAVGNAAILAINHHLGFVQHSQGGTYQFGPDTLGRWLAERAETVAGVNAH